MFQMRLNVINRLIIRRNKFTRLFSATNNNKNIHQPHYPGATKAKYTQELNIGIDKHVEPIYSILSNEGELVNKNYDLKLDKDTLIEIYRKMRTLAEMDKIFYDSQRQGRISFYMTSIGEEAATIGSAAALDKDDIVYTQYREAGVFMWRGFDLQHMADQLFSNCDDLGKGRQMPVHYGSNDLNMHTVSSPLATQIPHASGAAYAMKREGKKNVVVVYFGEGAASEGDFHAALNVAATTKSPVLFICRNNGYAISTPTNEQYKGDGIISRASGYGMYGVRVDGNDVLATHEAVQEARKFAIENSEPVLIELMTYRGGHHSTSDDSSRYRSNDEIQHWLKNHNPLVRTRLFLESKGWWDSDQESEVLINTRKEVLKVFNAAQKKKAPPISDLFSDVYDELPESLRRQQEELFEHLKNNPKSYPIDNYKPEESS